MCGDRGVLSGFSDDQCALVATRLAGLTDFMTGGVEQYGPAVGRIVRNPGVFGAFHDNEALCQIISSMEADLLLANRSRRWG